jgi:hypothetical protein
MYAWKCWRETRYRFIIFLVLNFACALLFADVMFRVNGPFPRPGYRAPEDIASVLHIYARIMFAWFAATSMFAGFVLGATGIGAEVESGTAEYLWTRPRRRSFFVEIHGLLCAVELIGLSVIPCAVIWLISGLRYQVWDNWRLLLAAPLGVIPAVFFLALTILMTAVRKSAASGLIFALGIASGYFGAAVYLEIYAKIHLPELTNPLLSWAGHLAGPEAAVFPWAAALRLAVLTALFVQLTRTLVKREEV